MNDEFTSGTALLPSVELLKYPEYHNSSRVDIHSNRFQLLLLAGPKFIS